MGKIRKLFFSSVFDYWTLKVKSEGDGLTLTGVFITVVKHFTSPLLFQFIIPKTGEPSYWGMRISLTYLHYVSMALNLDSSSRGTVAPPSILTSLFSGGNSLDTQDTQIES